MNEEIINKLKKFTDEEQEILHGKSEIDKKLYMNSLSTVIDSKKLLDNGGLIQVRTHTRFVHFPKHTHNYVEVVYMCEGHTNHVINGNKVTLNKGELLNNQRNNRSINQITMGLLFLQLMNHTDKVTIGENNFEQELMFTVLRFIEEHYKDGELSSLAETLHYELYFVSKIIKKLTGKTYTELIQAKRYETNMQKRTLFYANSVLFL